MYLEHFGLSESPFRITPHTDFFFDGADRGATLAALLYAVLHEEGIVKVSGEVGSGKTMLCRMLIERLPAEVDTVYLANPSLSRQEIMQAIAEDLDLEYSGHSATAAMRELVARLIELHASGRRALILIDEAHAMPPETLEQVRLLSNLETRRHKLLQIVLFGQPELDVTLDAPSMRQLKDRITHSFRTRPLTVDEAARYLGFRMRAAGYKGPDVFTPKSIALITRAASGLTRRINILADKALLAAFTEDRHAVDQPQVRAAIRDSEFARLPRRAGRQWQIAGWAAAIAAVLALGGYALFHSGAGEAPVPTAARTPAGDTPAPPAVASMPVTASPTTEAMEDSAPAPAATAAIEAQGLAPREPGEQVHDTLLRLTLDRGMVAPEPKPVAPMLTTDAAKRFAGYLPAGNKLLRERLAATRARLETEPDAHLSLELFLTDNSDPARTERFLQRARDLVDLSDLYVIPIADGRKYRLRITYGTFPDPASAEEAARRLPPKYRQAFRPEPRDFNELRSSL
jgi:MSHA biogenesis protein MshM